MKLFFSQFSSRMHILLINLAYEITNKRDTSDAIAVLLHTKTNVTPNFTCLETKMIVCHFPSSFNCYMLCSGRAGGEH